MGILGFTKLYELLQLIVKMYQQNLAEGAKCLYQVGLGPFGPSIMEVNRGQDRAVFPQISTASEAITICIVPHQ